MALSGPAPQNFDAENADNLEDIEKQFSVKVVQHLETYWAILQKVKGSTLRLTKLDDEIYEHLKRDFPDFDPAETINEEEMKSKAGKERWRKFMMAYEKRVDDYNFGTILRTNPKFEYEQDTTIFVPRFSAAQAARLFMTAINVKQDYRRVYQMECHPGPPDGERLPRCVETEVLDEADDLTRRRLRDYDTYRVKYEPAIGEPSRRGCRFAQIEITMPSESASPEADEALADLIRLLPLPTESFLTPAAAYTSMLGTHQLSTCPSRTSRGSRPCCGRLTRSLPCCIPHDGGGTRPANLYGRGVLWPIGTTASMSTITDLRENMYPPIRKLNIDVKIEIEIEIEPEIYRQQLKNSVPDAEPRISFARTPKLPRGIGPGALAGIAGIFETSSSCEIHTLLYSGTKSNYNFSAYRCSNMVELVSEAIHTVEFREAEGSLDPAWAVMWCGIVAGLPRFATQAFIPEFLEVLELCDRAKEKDGEYDIVDILDAVGDFC
ncbi:hypothetical protein DL764_001378 [Monosporascus ibericus]|uniref:Polysaccharide biosynthesis domain-containing protein n=1 Tax=Monosporascus ibericus TaxID=155417 RepID=A0A4Q4TPW1_9PEZI|nr:hypothetical protein DL764_001378 [Monosporascus ibericus]